MSTLRNSIPSRSYRERPQPLSRADAHPLLEKKRDYRLRARDHATKRARLSALRARAASRNPDEFAFGMAREGARAGGPRARGAANSGGVAADEEDGGAGAAGRGLPHGAVRLLKAQDAGYLRVARARVRRERLRREAALRVGADGLAVLGDVAGRDADGDDDDVDDDEVVDGRAARPGSAGGHVVFVDGEAAQAAFDARAHFATDEAGLRRAYNRPRRGGGGGGSSSSVASPDGDEEVKAARHTEKLRKRLAAVRAQERELGVAERELEMQRARMAGDVGGVDKKGVKWRARGRKR